MITIGITTKTLGRVRIRIKIRSHIRIRIKFRISNQDERLEQVLK